MASIHHEIQIDVPVELAWDALRDWGALHERLVPGFAVRTEIDGRDRIVTFFTGAAYRERIVDLNDAARRLVWSIIDGPYEHHNASAQVLAAPEGGTRFVWIADLLPDELAERTSGLMQQGLTIIKRTLAKSPVSVVHDGSHDGCEGRARCSASPTSQSRWLF